MGGAIIVVGAGAAGLMAAKQLCEAGENVIILEANNRLGGRMHTFTGDGFSQPIEAGAEFIHGDVPATLGLLKDAGIEYTRTGGKMYRSQNGKWVEREQPVEGWNELEKKMAELKEDATLQQFLQQYFGDEKHGKLRNQVKGFAEGFDVADPARVSVFMLRDEWEHEGPQYRIEGGYAQLVNFMANECEKSGCTIYLNTLVTEIEWVANEVTVHTNGNKFIGEKAVITVPVSLLQNGLLANSIKFIPSIDKYSTAANDIGYGDVIKVILEFKNCFWNEHKKDTGFIISNEWMPVWWTQQPANTPTLTGWLGGPKATALRDTDDEVILQNSMASLSSIFNLSQDELAKHLFAAKVYNWGRDAFAAGAYSYSTPGTKKALETLMKPIENTIFFAGEAIYNGPHPGTVEAALVSGSYAADIILSQHK